MNEPGAAAGQEQASTAAPPSGPSGQGILRTFGELLITVIESLSTRAELAFIDLQEALESLLGLMAWTAVAVIAASMTLFTGMLALLFIFWDTHRVLVAVSMVAVFAAIGCLAALALLWKLRSRRSLFAATLAELAHDRERLRRRP